MVNRNFNIETLITVVRTVAKEELLPRFSKVIAEKKTDGSIVTEADIAVQHKIKTQLERLDESILFLSEEMPVSEQKQYLQQDSKAIWILDPLDGTTNFAAGIPYYSISLALLEKGEPVIAVVYDPEREECFIAEKNSGAKLLTTNMPVVPLSLSENPVSLKDAVACIDLKRLPAELAIKIVTRHPFRSQRSFGGVALDWCWLAAGRFDVYLHGKQNIWDYAAGHLIFTESGGFSSTLDDEPVFVNQLTHRTGLGAVSASLFNEWAGWLQVPQATGTSDN